MKAKKTKKILSKLNRKFRLFFVSVVSLVLVVAILGVISQNKQSAKSEAAATYVSLIYYPGWVQSGLPPSQIDYTAFTHIMHFGMYPTTSGSVALADMQSTSFPPAAVAAAHAAGKKIILVIGGEGQGAGFVGATSSTNLPKFVTNIVNTMKQYGYDGVDIDWEENVTQAPYVALVQQLRAALNNVSPRPWLSAAVDTGQHPPAIVAAAAPSLDYINIMTYWDNGVSTYTAYTQAGIPASKLVLGLGVYSGYYDTTAAKFQTKITYVQQTRMAGVMGWQVGDFKTPMTDPRLQPLRNLVASNNFLPTPTPLVTPTIAPIPTDVPPTIVPVPTGTVEPTAIPTPAPKTTQLLTAPKRLRVTATTVNTVSLAWNAAGGNVVSYSVSRGDSRFRNSVVVGQVAANVLTFKDTGLAARTTYGYCVRAVDINGAVSPSSNCVTATTTRR